ncbi:MAG: toprim domain-containing protein [Deltaproteobacteria bacterium]|nr:toprim domain-containing protein [Deltaproteobacteria bacterium]
MGFEIEKYNQYNLEVNAKTSICPLCSHTRKKKTQKCLMLDWRRGWASCSHCGEILQLHTYKKKTQIQKIYKKPEWKNKTDLPDSLVKWFEKRKISQHTLKLMKISFGDEWMPQTKKVEKTMQFNYFKDNELINIKYRDSHKNFKMFKDAEKIFYNLDCVKNSKDVIIAEGEIEILSFVECGLLHCISTPNGSTLKGVNLEYLDNCIDYFENKEKIYLALDNDEPGNNVKKELIRRLGAERCYLVDLEDCNDPNEYLVKYGKERLRQTIEKAKQVPLESVQTLQTEKQALHDFYINGLHRGLMTGIKSFDKVFSILKKQILLVTGIKTHGKSDFVDMITTGWSLTENLKGAFCSVENKPTVLHIDKLCRKIYGKKPLTEAVLNSDNWKQTEDYVNDNFFFIDFEKGGYDLERVLQKVKELVVRKGINWFVLDPLNKIRYKGKVLKITGIQVNDYASEYMSILENFCNENDLICILVAHPKKMEKENGKRAVPDIDDVKGGGELTDMVHHSIVVHRMFDLRIVKVKILKCKFQHLGTNNAECHYAWNTENGRYTELKNEEEVLNATENPSFDLINSSYLDENDVDIVSCEIPINSGFDIQVKEDDIPF